MGSSPPQGSDAHWTSTEEKRLHVSSHPPDNMEFAARHFFYRTQPHPQNVTLNMAPKWYPAFPLSRFGSFRPLSFTKVLVLFRSRNKVLVRPFLTSTWLDSEPAPVCLRFDRETIAFTLDSFALRGLVLTPARHSFLDSLPWKSNAAV